MFQRGSEAAKRRTGEGYAVAAATFDRAAQLADRRRRVKAALFRVLAAQMYLSLGRTDLAGPRADAAVLVLRRDPKAGGAWLPQGLTTARRGALESRTAESGAGALPRRAGNLAGVRRVRRGGEAATRGHASLTSAALWRTVRSTRRRGPSCSWPWRRGPMPSTYAEPVHAQRHGAAEQTLGLADSARETVRLRRCDLRGGE